MGFGSKVEHRFDPLLYQKAGNQPGVADVPPNKPIVGVVLHPGQVFQVTGIGEQVEVHHPTARIGRHKIIDEIGTDEARTAGDQDGTGGKRCGHRLSHVHIARIGKMEPIPDRVKLIRKVRLSNRSW